MVEFTLVGIPLLFVLVSIFEVARGMWIYQTLAYAMKETARFVIVKGENCVATGNSCGVTVQQISSVIQNRGVGLLPGQLNITLISTGSTVTCNPLSSCSGNTTPWPTLTTPADPGSGRGRDITVTGTYPFRTALSLFWPGSRGQGSLGVFTLGASSRERIEF